MSQIINVVKRIDEKIVEKFFNLKSKKLMAVKVVSSASQLFRNILGVEIPIPSSRLFENNC